MGAQLKGLSGLEKQLNKKLGKKRTAEIVDKALIKAGTEIQKIIKGNVMTYKDTGEMAKGTSLSKPMTINGTRVIKIHWTGDHRTLVHLNERGFYAVNGDFIDPNKGVIDRAMIKGRKVYFAEIKRQLEKELSK